MEQVIYSTIGFALLIFLGIKWGRIFWLDPEGSKKQSNLELDGKHDAWSNALRNYINSPLYIPICRFITLGMFVFALLFLISGISYLR